MKTRILTAAVALPILIASIVLPSYFPETFWIFVIIAAAALAAGLFEFYSLTKKLELKGDASIAYLGSAAIFANFLFDGPAKGADILLATLAAFVIVVLITQTFRFQKDFTKMLAGIGVTLLGPLYIAFLGGMYIGADSPFKETSPEQYARAAGAVSLFAFIIGFDQNTFRKFLITGSKARE